LLTAAQIHAQQRQYVFSRISNKEGLASSYVSTIMQDKMGFMWFGTANGLQRYDGRKIIMFRAGENEKDYLPAQSISQIFEDKKGNFWVRCGSEIGIFDPATFRYKRATIKLNEPVPVRSEYNMWQDSKGTIFLIIKRHKYLTYDAARHEFSEKANPFELPTNWKPVVLQEDPQTHNYWVVTDSGLVYCDVKSKQVSYAGHNVANFPILENKLFRKNVTSFYIDRNYLAWLAAWPFENAGQTFYCYDLKTNRVLPETKGINESTPRYHELHDFFEQKNGKLWAYGRMLLLERDSSEHQFNFIRNEHIDDYGIKYEMLLCMYEDREQNIWLGTDEGVYVFNPSVQHFNSMELTNVSNAPGFLEEKTVNCFLQTNSNQVWVGSWGKGVAAYDINFHRLSNNITSQGLGRDQQYLLVWSMQQQRRSGDKIFIGCQAGRLITHEPQTNTTQYLKPSVFDGKTIRQIVEDKKGNMWFGTQYGHLVKWDPKKGGSNIEAGFELVQNLQTIIYKLFVDSSGYLWACAHQQGVYRIDPETGKIIAHYREGQGAGKSLFSDMANDIVQYNDSLFFISSNALNILNVRNGNIEQLTTASGLPSQTIATMGMDLQGTIWLGTLTGLVRYNYQKDIFTLFTQRDGVLNTDFQTASSYRLNSGKMLFGNSHDFVFFQPETITPSTAPPDVSITDFKLFNTYLPPDSILSLDKVRLNPTQNSITIEFISLSMLQKDKISYYYKMEGIDDEWTRADHLFFANYTLLPPGDYTFKVYCENGAGIPSKNVTSLKIFITPPFWRTWWFTLLGLMFLAGLIYAAYRLRINRLLAMEKVRARIARDLHDDMGSTLSTINILSEMAKMKVDKDPMKTEEYLNKISDNSSRMMEAMDDIVWSINPMNDSMQRITARMREFATGVLEAKDIDFTFRVDDEVKELKLDMEGRRDFFLLFKEAVNNLAKYSNCRHASIDISVDKSRLVMKIQDDGQGFDVASADSGNGLTNMRKRAQTLGGMLDISSCIDKGTVVILKVPV
jgi:ligand-binding sensor domain-containing protein/two-component sensor histidine kinase